MTPGQISDYTGAAALLGSLPNAEWLIADRGYDADWFREALKDKGIKPCIPGRKSRSKAVRYDKRRYKRRNRIEIMFGRLKDWRCVATRYDRCEPPRIYRRVICSYFRRPYRVSSGLHRTPPLLLRAGYNRWGQEGGDCYTNRPISRFPIRPRASISMGRSG